ncbi:hypothetical protein [Streptomyces sp. NPDC015414]|uniref:hypothetical protein n=1 Tax=Streptomyces sp. NPDC015414 TaxID=3364957 RepID=UPI0036F7621A
MGYLRTGSFMIFSDEGAPVEERKLSSQEIAKLEAAHQAAKAGRIEDLIKRRLTPAVRRVAITPGTPWGASSPFHMVYMDPMMSRGIVHLGGTEWLGGMHENIQAEQEALRKRQADAQAAAEARQAKEAEEKAQAEETAKKRMNGPEGEQLRRIVAEVQGAGGDQEALKKFIREDHELRQQGSKHLRDFAWDVFSICTSTAKLPDLRYKPCRMSTETVRFKDGCDYWLGVNEVGRQIKVVNGKQVAMTETETIHDQGATLWVKVGDGGWSKDGNWGGYLQVDCATAKGKWIDSSNGWVTTVAGKGDPVTFYDMGTHYQIWQGDRETGRPLTVEGDYLRFNKGATPGKFNLDSF